MVREVLFCSSCTHPRDYTGVYSSSSASALRACGTGGVGFSVLSCCLPLLFLFLLYIPTHHNIHNTVYFILIAFFIVPPASFSFNHSFYSFPHLPSIFITPCVAFPFVPFALLIINHNLNRLWAHRSLRVREEEEEREEEKKRAAFIH